MDLHSYLSCIYDWNIKNNHKIKPEHIAIYIFIANHAMLVKKNTFLFCPVMAFEFIGIKSYSKYIKYLNELISLGLIKLHEKPKNKYAFAKITINIK